MGRIIGLGFKTQLLIMVLSKTVCSALFLCSCAVLIPHCAFNARRPSEGAIGHGWIEAINTVRQCLGLSPQPQLLQSQSVKFRDCSNPEETAFRRQPGGRGRSKCARQCDLFLILSSGTTQLNSLRLEVRRCFLPDILSMHSGVRLLRYAPFHPLRL